jgi:hypothetical protein
VRDSRPATKVSALRTAPDSKNPASSFLSGLCWILGNRVSACEVRSAAAGAICGYSGERTASAAARHAAMFRSRLRISWKMSRPSWRDSSPWSTMTGIGRSKLTAGWLSRYSACSSTPAGFRARSSGQFLFDAARQCECLAKSSRDPKTEARAHRYRYGKIAIGQAGLPASSAVVRRALLRVVVLAKVPPLIPVGNNLET